MFPANSWGLHDMHGNLCQWCEDRYAPYKEDDNTDPVNLKKDREDSRVLRGGSWFYPAWRAAYRDWGRPNIRGESGGCRVVFQLDNSSQQDGDGKDGDRKDKDA